ALVGPRPADAAAVVQPIPRQTTALPVAGAALLGVAEPDPLGLLPGAVAAAPLPALPGVRGTRRDAVGVLAGGRPQGDHETGADRAADRVGSCQTRLRSRGHSGPPGRARAAGQGRRTRATGSRRRRAVRRPVQGRGADVLLPPARPPLAGSG